MTAQPPIEIRCLIRSIEEPIRGELIDQEGNSSEFRGWIELAGGLTSMAEAARGPQTTEVKEIDR